MTQTVVGLFKDISEAEVAVTMLENAGIPTEDIKISNKQDAVTGEGSSTAAAGSTEHESGIKHFFKSLFGDDDQETDRYSSLSSSGSSVVTVESSSPEQSEHIATILDEAGALNVDDHAAASDTAYADSSASFAGTGSQDPASTGNTQTSGATGGAQKLAVTKENVEVGKRTAETGTVRIRSRIVERPYSADVKLHDEKVVIERTPVDRVVADSDQLFKDQEYKLVETAEIPVISKQTRVVEEVLVGMRASDHTETINTTLHDTAVDVEREEATTSESANANVLIP